MGTEENQEPALPSPILSILSRFLQIAVSAWTLKISPHPALPSQRGLFRAQAEATPLARAHVPCCPLAPARRASADPDAPCLFDQHLLTLTARRADAAHASEMKQESNPSFKITGGESPNLGEDEEKHTLFVSGKLSWGAGQTET